jgi:curved DNA-binding protein CbpA
VSAKRPFDPTLNYYQILDVPVDASREEIVRAYRQLMRLTHPDKFRDPLDRQKAEARTKEINAAYSVLSKPELRKEYDNAIRRTVMADVLMQRYTGNHPGASSPLQRRRRTPAPQTVRVQKDANRRALFQVVRTFVVVVGILLVLATLAGLLSQGAQALIP